MPRNQLGREKRINWEALSFAVGKRMEKEALVITRVSQKGTLRT